MSLPHAVPMGWCVSAGHVVDEPVHFSSRSHVLGVALRQTCVLGRRRSGHGAVVPVQKSSASHAAPDEVPHWKLLGRNELLGQAVVPALHVSARSHGPALLRHVYELVNVVHVPAVTLQAWQSLVTPPPHVVLQQTPSTQLPDEHCAPVEHAVPFPHSSWCVRMNPSDEASSPTAAVMPSVATARPRWMMLPLPGSVLCTAEIPDGSAMWLP